MMSKASQALLRALLSPNKGFLQSKHLLTCKLSDNRRLLLLLKMNYAVTCWTCGKNIPYTSLI